MTDVERLAVALYTEVCGPRNNPAVTTNRAMLTFGREVERFVFLHDALAEIRRVGNEERPPTPARPSGTFTQDIPWITGQDTGAGWSDDYDLRCNDVAGGILWMERRIDVLDKDSPERTALIAVHNELSRLHSLGVRIRGVRTRHGADDG